MHLLDTDASDYPLQWYMDSPMLREGEEKLSMIKTQSRIDTSLTATIGDAVIGGSRFPTSHCRGFSTAPRITFGIEFSNRRKTTPERSVSPEKTRSASEEANDSRRDCEVPTSPPHSHENKPYHKSPQSRESSLNGFINGFIVHKINNTKEESLLSETKHSRETNHHQTHCTSVKRERSPCLENKNCNNNTIPISKLPGHGGAEHHKDRYAEIHRKVTGEFLDYRQPDVADGAEGDKVLNGSDILRRMYASFGSHPGEANGILTPSFGHSQGKSPPNTAQERQNPPCDSTRKRAESPTEKIMLECGPVPQRKSIERSFELDSRTCGKPRGLTKNYKMDTPCEKSSKSSDKPSRDYEPDTTKRHLSPRKELHRKSKSNSSPHSIDSLLSCHRNISADEYQQSNCLHGNRKDEIMSKSQVPQEAQTLHRRKREISADRTNEYSDPENRDLSPKRRRSNDLDVYNEKSREIFRQDKEIIENSIRPNPQFPYSAISESSLHSPPWQSSSAMDAFQANLLSSFPQNGVTLSEQALLMKSASIAAAANPLLLSMNPCLMNPYLLRNFGSSEVAAAAAYHQAMTQGLLQNHPAFYPLLNQGLLGNPGLHSGLNPLAYGLTEPSQIAAAIAASVRQNTAAFYPNSQVPYPLLPQHLGQMEDPVNNGSGSIKTGTSPRRSASPKQTICNGLGQVSSKYRRSDEETRPEASTISREDNSRTTCKDFMRTPIRPRMEDRKYPSAKQTKSCSSSSMPSCQKRKSPALMSPDNLPTQSKKKLCTTTKLDTTYKKSRELSPTPFLKPPKTKHCDESKVPPALVDKSRGVEKSSARPSSYKNLTRERRLVANARERTRVHTISSAFEELRQQIPSYSCNQKLSKLAILRIACSYIQSLSVLAGRSNEGTFKESVDQCTRVLQAESRARSRRKNNKAQIEWEVANYEKTANYDSDDRRKADAAGQSPETSHLVCQRGTTGSSLSREVSAQVHGENGYHGLDDSPHFHRESSGDISHPTNTTRSDDTDECPDQSHENAIEDNAMTPNDSLDAKPVQMKRSPVNASDRSCAWRQHAKPSREDFIPRNNIWQGETTDNDRVASPAEEDEESNSDRLSPDDQHNDLINVED